MGEVIIDPERRFGKPNVSGVYTWIIKERFIAGESIAEIAKDYDLTEFSIEDALRYEMTRRRKHPMGLRKEAGEVSCLPLDDKGSLPTVTQRKTRILFCPKCNKRRRVEMRFEEWYGWSATCKAKRKWRNGHEVVCNYYFVWE